MYTLNDREGFSWLSSVYILNGRQGCAISGREESSRPLGAFFGLPTPKTPLGFGALTPSPAGDLIIFYLNLLGSRLPNLLTGLALGD